MHPTRPLGRPFTPRGGQPGRAAAVEIDAVTGGLRLRVRPITPDDRRRLAAAMAALSERSRYQRFFAATQELSDAQLSYFTEPDGVDHLALAATTREQGEEQIAGAVRCVRLADPAVADVSVAVVDRHQGRGVGTLLLRLLAARAREQGMERFSAMVLPENTAMLAVFRRLGAAVEFDHQQRVMRVDLDLEAV